MVKQLFPSNKVAQPLSPLDKIEEAKKCMEDENLRELEDAIQNCIGTTDPVHPVRIPDRLFDVAVEQANDRKMKQMEIERAESLHKFRGVEPSQPKAIKVIEAERPVPKHGKVMFQDKAIIDTIDDLPLGIRQHPIIQGMNNRNIRRAYFLSKDLKITDTAALFSHGDSRRELFNDVVNQIVDTAKGSAAQKADTVVMTIINTMKTTDIRTLLKTEKQSWFHSLFHSDNATPLEHTNDWFDDATKLIDDQLIEVDAIIATLLSRVDQLNKLYNTNKDSFELLQIEIAAGKFFIDAAEAEIATAEGAKDAFAASDAAYHKMSLEQFRNKIVDLESVAQSVLTNAPQIRMMQLNIQGVGERIKTVKLVYARWKSQFANIVTAFSHALAHTGTKPGDAVKLLDQQFSSELAEFSAIQASL